MARIRTIQPHFPRSASMCRVSRDARLLFIQLWLVADDAGRLPFNTAVLTEELYSCDEDAAALLPSWLDALEREGCVERYTTGGRDYLRIVKWRRHQTIDRPTPSALPGAPREYGERREQYARSRTAQGSVGNPREELEKDETPIVATQQRTLRHIDRIRAKAEADCQYTPALRAVAMEAQLGWVAGQATQIGQSSGLSPADLLPEELPDHGNGGA